MIWPFLGFFPEGSISAFDSITDTIANFFSSSPKTPSPEKTPLLKERTLQAKSHDEEERITPWTLMMSMSTTKRKSTPPRPVATTQRRF